MAQQTAIDWLEEKFNKWAEGRQFILHDYFEIAKNKEKQQIMNAWLNGDADSMYDPKQLEEQAEQYYKETYGKSDNL